MLLTEATVKQMILRIIMLHIPVRSSRNLARGFISLAPRGRATLVVIMSRRLRADKVISKMTNVLIVVGYLVGWNSVDSDFKPQRSRRSRKMTLAAKLLRLRPFLPANWFASGRG